MPPHATRLTLRSSDLVKSLSMIRYIGYDRVAVSEMHPTLSKTITAKFARWVRLPDMFGSGDRPGFRSGSSQTNAKMVVAENVRTLPRKFESSLVLSPGRNLGCPGILPGKSFHDPCRCSKYPEVRPKSTPFSQTKLPSFGTVFL